MGSGNCRPWGTLFAQDQYPGVLEASLGSYATDATWWSTHTGLSEALATDLGLRPVSGSTNAPRDCE